MDEAETEALIQAADQIVAGLRKRKWGGIGRMTIMNEFADKQVDQPMAGVLFFGTVKRIVSGDSGSRGALLQLAGTDRTLFLPLDGTLLSAEPGNTYLVLGVNYDGQVVRYGDNPLRLIQAPIIATRTLLPCE